MKLKIDSIIIGERQRVKYSNLSHEELLKGLDSMADPEVGQIAAITVHKLLNGYELVDGYRRLNKAKELGWVEIDAHEKDTLTEVQKKKCELFADIERQDRAWQDRCLSIAEIHDMISRERRALGQSWGLRVTAAATNFGKTYLGRLLEVSDALRKDPKDEELWKQDNFFGAYQVLVRRAEAEARVELERRRAELNKQQGLVLKGDVEEAVKETWVDADNGEHPIESLVHNVDTTEEGQRPLKIYIQGNNMRFIDAIFGEHLLEETAYCVIAYNIHESGDNINKIVKHIQLLLRPEGFAVFWYDENHNFPDLATIWMQWPLIWNKISYCESNWPFCPNYGIARVMCKEGIEPTKHPNPSGSVVSAMPNDDGTLPPSVVDFTLKACCPPNLAVITLNSELAVTIAECGNIPIFFEPDKAKFDKVCNDLKEYYERNIPGVEVILP